MLITLLHIDTSMGTIPTWYMSLRNTGTISDIVPLRKMLPKDSIIIMATKDYSLMQIYRNAILDGMANVKDLITKKNLDN